MIAMKRKHEAIEYNTSLPQQHSSWQSYIPVPSHYDVLHGSHFKDEQENHVHVEFVTNMWQRIVVHNLKY
jgi:uncharacterized protein YbdZ (MbtH family)